MCTNICFVVHQRRLSHPFYFYHRRILRESVGDDAKIAVDANQVWSVPEAIKWMEELAQFNIYWIEEPTSPDDILGHLEISRALKKHGRISLGRFDH